LFKVNVRGVLLAVTETPVRFCGRYPIAETYIVYISVGSPLEISYSPSLSGET
jgi:hypothetical protein